MIRLLITFVAGLVLVVFPAFPALAAFDDSDMGFVEPATQDNLEYCEGDFEALCFGDYYKVLPLLREKLNEASRQGQATQLR